MWGMSWPAACRARPVLTVLRRFGNRSGLAAGTMERFIRRKNIERYRKLLAETQDEAERQVIARLLAAEEKRETGETGQPAGDLRRIP